MPAKVAETEIETTKTQVTPVVTPLTDKKMQNTVTAAIILSVVLFFAGLGLGYLAGRETAIDMSDRDHMDFDVMQRNYQRGSFDGSGMRGRGIIDDSTQINDSNSSTNTQEY